MQVESEQEEQRRIEDEIIDQWNYEDAESVLDWATPDDEFIDVEEHAEEIDWNKPLWWWIK